MESSTSTSTCCCAGGAHVEAVVAGVGYGGVNIIDAKDGVSNNMNDHDSDEDYIKDVDAVANDNDRQDAFLSMSLSLLTFL